jgi:hypothetical protein
MQLYIYIDVGRISGINLIKTLDILYKYQITPSIISCFDNLWLISSINAGLNSFISIEPF